jgi:hypothetical protein
VRGAMRTKMKKTAPLALALLAILAVAGVRAMRADTPKPDRAAEALCAAARASIAKTGFTEDHRGKFHMTGTWQVSGGASGVYIEDRIDSDRYGSESQRGAAGQWVYDDNFPECDNHTARVHVFPVVTVGGRDVICLSQDKSVPAPFESSCLPTAEIVGCAWKCEPGPSGACTGECTGKGTGDAGGYAPFWGRNDGGYQAGTAPGKAGPWTDRITCVRGERVSFKVRGHAGTGGWSPPVEIPCGQEKPTAAPPPAG